MKRILNILALLLMVSSLSIVTSCVSDGDETVSLEYGRVRKMIVGRWKIDKIQRGDKDDWRGFRIRDWEPGTTLVFFDDGTYKDSSDKGDGRLHHWRLKGRDYDDEPYYGGIILDEDEFDFDSFGPGRWILHWPSGYDDDDDNPGWRIGLDKESDDPEDEPEPEPDPEPEYEYIYRVKQIDKSYYHENDGEPQYESTQHYYFTYDDEGRISRYVTPQNTFRYEYTDGVEVVRLYDASVGEVIKWCYRGPYGYVTKEEGQYRLDYSGAYVYDDDGYLNVVDGTDGGCTLKDFGSRSFTVVLYENSKERYCYYKTNTYPNNANIDLNCFVSVLADSAPYHQTAMLPFEFYGKKHPEIICLEMIDGYDYYSEYFEVTKNEHDLPSKISFKTILHSNHESLGNTVVDIYYDAIRVE